MLKRSGDYSAALDLLQAEIESQERVSVEQKCGVAPWYYEQAAIIHRESSTTLMQDCDTGALCAAIATPQELGRGNC
jgi:hypothetical protein